MISDLSPWWSLSWQSTIEALYRAGSLRACGIHSLCMTASLACGMLQCVCSQPLSSWMIISFVCAWHTWSCKINTFMEVAICGWHETFALSFRHWQCPLEIGSAWAERGRWVGSPSGWKKHDYLGLRVEWPLLALGDPFLSSFTPPPWGLV